MFNLSRVKLYVTKGLNILLQPASFNNCRISQKAKICSGSSLTNVDVDDYSYLGHDCFCVNAEIKKYCSIADNCSIGGASHPIHFVSTSPVFCSGKNILRMNFSNHKYDTSVRSFIGNDVWLGRGVFIKAGVTVSDGAVIGMGSIVTKNVGPYEIWAGNPAKMIKKRFPDEIIEKLCKIKWWDWDEEKIREYSIYFNDVDKLIERAEAL